MGLSRQAQGFTLLEILVTVTLIGIFLLVTVPRLPTPLSADPARRASRWILNTVSVLKREAVCRQTPFTLHVDMAANRLRVTHEAGRGPAAPASALSSLSLEGGVRLTDVQYPQKGIVAAGDAPIRFYPQGYSDRAIIHLTAADNRRFSFVVEPFLSRARMIEGVKGYAE